MGCKASKAGRCGSQRGAGKGSITASHHSILAPVSSRREKEFLNEQPQVLHKTQHPAVPTDPAGSHSLQRLPIRALSVEWRVFGSTEPSRHHNAAPVFLVVGASGEARTKIQRFDKTAVSFRCLRSLPLFV